MSQTATHRLGNTVKTYRLPVLVSVSSPLLPLTRRIPSPSHVGCFFCVRLRLSGRGISQLETSAVRSVG